MYTLLLILRCLFNQKIWVDIIILTISPISSNAIYLTYLTYLMLNIYTNMK